MIHVIRLMSLTTAFILATAALLWVLGAPPEPDRPSAEGRDLVSQNVQTPLSLQPAISAVPQPIRPAVVVTAPTPKPAPIRPRQRPDTGVFAVQKAALQSAVAPAAPAQLRPVMRQEPVTQPPATASNGDSDVMDALQAMTMGILEDMPKPTKAEPADETATLRQAPAPQAPAIAPRDVRVAPPAPAPAPVPERTYLVKEGDSLPGIAFRFFGTTVAYLQILDANQDILNSPGDLRAGMTLRIPES